MVLFGLLFQRAFRGAVLAMLLSGSVYCLRAAELDDVTGTMPEDYLPELKAILAEALRRSPDAIGREFDRLAQEARLTIVNSARLPQVGGSFNYGINQQATASNTSSTTRDSGFFYSFGLSQALFHWGALKNQTESARISLVATNRAHAVAYRELSTTIRKAYLALIVEKARLRQARELRALTAADVEVATVKKADGLISGAALATDQLRLREVDAELARFEAEFAANLSRFGRLAGLEAFKEEQVPNTIPRPDYSEPRALAMTADLLRDNGKGTMEWEIYELRLREAVLRQKIEATRLWPKFGLGAGYSLTNTTTVDNNLVRQSAVTSQNVNVGGSWNMFDGLATRGVKREALIAKRKLEHEKSTDIERLLQNAQILERTLKVDAESLDLADIRHGNATEAQRLVEDDVKFGTRAKVEIGRARQNVLYNEMRSLEARAVYLGHWAEFVAIAGDDPVLKNLPDRHVRKKN